MDEVNLSELTSIIEQNLNRVFFSEVLIWYRNEETDSEKKRLLDQKIFDHYKTLGMEMLSDYDKITTENFPFLSREKGIILFYEDVSLKIYAYTLTELREDNEPIIFENIKNVFRIGDKYKTGTIHRTLGSLLEDISYSDAIRQHILSEVKSTIKNNALDESSKILEIGTSL